MCAGWGGWGRSEGEGGWGVGAKAEGALEPAPNPSKAETRAPEAKEAPREPEVITWPSDLDGAQLPEQLHVTLKIPDIPE